MNTKYPDYLYQYPSLDSLALILKGRCIRLTSLDRMDDPQENVTADVINYGRFFFVSCWTASTTESIPMWNMYTPIERGVRFGLPRNPFKRQGTDLEEFAEVTGDYPATGPKTGTLNTFLDFSDLARKGIFSDEAWAGDILFPVTYTEDKNLLEPRIKGADLDNLTLGKSAMGRYKNKAWAFQEEWRYMMHFFTMKSWNNVAKLKSELAEGAQAIVEGVHQVPIEHYFLEIDPAMFKKMVITPSPKMSDGNRVLLEALLKEYNPDAVMEVSGLQGLL